MNDFEKGISLLTVAKLSALETTLQKHFPEAYQSYFSTLKTLVEEEFLRNRFDGSPHLKEAVMKQFGLIDSQS